ncbi:type II secretion system protein [Candidatus Koribacter versatilis Ellin345]|uniref:Type II secretion system protein n=1 Tax=Koribacter versatilis (strain Ellin345) TaxID=204669 RepID=Q1IRV8_KORVE|nr:type II secretion system F family protein [Candidatus Koribacter versatilis]ABF40392.1 type II secretion system protein [Candidatus Koribacter versatilis Ellin345]
MPVFTFTGKNATGEKVTGERVAENKQALASNLRRERIQPVTIKEKGKEFVMPTFGGGSVKTKDIAIFFRQFSVMIDAGLPLVQCLEILAGNQESQAFQKALNGVRTTVEGGSTLGNAMRGYPKIFDDLMVNMVDAGETGGILDTILQRLATYVEKAVKLKAAVRSALIYPVSVITIAVLIVGLLLWKVVPIFANLFVGLGAPLPLPTRIVIGISNFLGSFWWMVPIMVAAVFFGVRALRSDPRGRYLTDNFLLHIPIIGMLLRKIAVARFTRTLGTLITSGVPILEGLNITARTSGNRVVEEALYKVRKSIEEGRTIVDPLRESAVFPNMVTQMIGVGEATGAMDAMLQKIADFYEDEVDAATKDLLTLLEPIMIVLLGIMIGGVVVSLYLPLFSMVAKLSGGG